ncbi:hypothetical protein QKG26_gp099 [Chelonid alphaherpesvirus 5]|uniref:Uncharacterized protein n=1 Tax=Chelonid alphaherpesvirus 5 TaxID=702736 RepID=V5NWM5_9ALPH|nr:hypothetical protein QKG26_gp099 [Chelonid alphaherpesvirus 5]AHA93381.1 hypothetical protein [Chelonid alphaherpesvirus 5]
MGGEVPAERTAVDIQKEVATSRVSCWKEAVRIFYAGPSQNCGEEAVLQGEARRVYDLIRRRWHVVSLRLKQSIASTVFEASDENVPKLIQFLFLHCGFGYDEVHTVHCLAMMKSACFSHPLRAEGREEVRRCVLSYCCESHLKFLRGAFPTEN